MNSAHFQNLYAYTFWMHRQVWTCMEELREEQFTQDLDYSIGSLQNQCIHTLGVEYWWIHFLATGELDFVDVESLSTRPAIRAAWDAVETEVTGYLAALTAAELERLVKPPFWDEQAAPVHVWQALFQVANHSTDHRSQMLAGLHRVGGRTLEQDYLEYHFAHSPAPDTPAQATLL
ncbi:MAG: DinB family protein [Litorilinea sp.]